MNYKVQLEFFEKLLQNYHLSFHYLSENTESEPIFFFFFRRLFKPDLDYYKIADEIKRCVTFKEHNLLKDVYPKDYDLILCRNVVIYFTEEAKDEIYRKFNQSLVKEGVLFIGSTEQITNYKDLNYIRNKSFFFEKA